MKIGVVTVTYNSESVLKDFVSCLSNQSHKDFILYVVDNNSSDNTLGLIEALLPDSNINFKIIKNSANLGVACGNNIGIKMALADECDAIIIANNDIEFSADTFNELHIISNRNQRQLIAPKVLFYDNQNLIWCAGGHFSKLRGVPRTHGYRNIDGGNFQSEYFVTSVPTCFLFVPSEVFRAVGLMDEDFFVYLDDSDFVHRVNEAGFKILYVPCPKILHKVSVSTGGENSPFTIYQITKNTILFLRKNYSDILFGWYLMVFFIRCALKIPFYDKVQRQKMTSGFIDGVKKCIEMGSVKHNFPVI